MNKKNFADRFLAAVKAKGNPLCVGLDPRWSLLPKELRQNALQKHGRTPKAAAEAFIAFNREVLDAVSAVAPICKPQIAFYEEFGVEGLRAYAETIAYARRKGLLVISDAKRGDIGSTAAAYAPAHLGEATDEEGADENAFNGGFGADALTINPYLGGDSLTPFLETAAARGAGLFILVKTSNPGSRDFQDLPIRDASGEQVTLADKVADMVSDLGKSLIGDGGFSSVGAVVGATHPEEARRLRERMPKTLFLIPGYGAQGASAKDAVAGFASGGLAGTVNSSRGIIFSWKQKPYAEKYGEDRRQEAIRAAAEAAAEELNAALRVTLLPI
jgi:orotidine-5'-phosphate decarboxylase